MSEIQRLNGELRDRVATLESGVELTELRARNGDLERLAGELKSSQWRIASRQRAIARGDAGSEQLPTSSRSSMQQQLQTNTNRLRARVAELEQALAHALSDVEALRSAARDAVVGVPSDLAALEQSLRDSKQLLGRARADARAAQQDAEDARGALQAATEALDAADEEQSALRRDADDAREQLVQYKERSSRLVIAESVAAAARATDQQRRVTSTAIADAVQRGKRSMAASAAADVARIRAKYVALLAQAARSSSNNNNNQQAPALSNRLYRALMDRRATSVLSDAVSSETPRSAVNNRSAPAKKRVSGQQRHADGGLEPRARSGLPALQPRSVGAEDGRDARSVCAEAAAHESAARRARACGAKMRRKSGTTCSRPQSSRSRRR
jgi:chromosome segregation ATPase